MLVDSKDVKEFLVRRSLVSVYFMFDIDAEKSSDVFSEFENYEHFLVNPGPRRIVYSEELILRMIISWNNDNVDVD
jgi:hypothetical protein